MTSASAERLPVISLALLIVFASLIVGLPYWVPDWALPKSEDFEYTVLPTRLYAQQIITNGYAPWWNPLVGLGSPWPVPTGMTHSPFTLLLALLPTMTVVGVVAAAHTAVMGVATAILFARHGLRGQVLLVAVLSLVLSTSLEYLYWSDAIGVYVTWTMVVPLFLAADIVLRGSIATSSAAAIGMGGLVGYVVLNGHAGVLAIYLVGLAIFVLAHPALLLRKIPFFALAIILAAGIGAEKIAYLMSETSRFDPAAYRAQQGLIGGLPGMLYNAFLRPLFLPDLSRVNELGGWLSGFVAANNYSRTVGFGVVLTVFAVLAFVRPRLTGTWREGRSFALTLLFSFMLILWPKAWLPSVISATWPLRDIVMIAGLILSGTAFQRWSAERPAGWRRWTPSRLLLLQTAAVGFSALALIAGANWLNVRGKATAGEYDRLANPADSTGYSALLAEALGKDGVSGGRFVSSGEAFLMMDTEKLVDQGAVNNLGLVHGFAEVSFIGKGLSFDTIRPSQYVPYGTITGERMRRWSLDIEAPTDWTRDDQALLSFLGIEAVVTEASEPVSAPGLERVGSLNGVDGFSLAVYRNKDALPLIFAVPPPLLDSPIPARVQCDEGGLYCLDLRGVVAAAQPQGFSASIEGDRLAVRREQAEGQSAIVTQMFREEWTLSPADITAGVSITPWNGVMRIDFPQGVREANLVYRPHRLIGARAVTIWFAAAWTALALGSAIWCSLRARRFRKVLAGG